MTQFKHLIGVFSLVVITLNLVFWLIPLTLLAFLKLIIPLQGFKDKLYGEMLRIYALAVWVDKLLLERLLGIQFDVSGLSGLQKEKTYLVIANHRSWADILILQNLLIQGAPIIKFIVKREILFLPLVGLICWAYEYPFVTRNSLNRRRAGKGHHTRDLNRINQKLEIRGNHSTTIINFVEGTRFNLIKSKQTDSSYRHLLRPRAGGLAYILQTLGPKIDAILDITIVYDCREPVFWNLLNGSCRRVKVDVQLIPMQPLLATIKAKSDSIEYTSVSNWLEQFWNDKDQKINQFTAEFKQLPN